jgi:putative transposase
VFPPDSVLHVVNRGNDRRTLFGSSVEYAQFRQLLDDSRSRVSVALLAFVLMPNHWHLVVQPPNHSVLSQFLHRLTGIHAKRTRMASSTVGEGHIYQGRYHAVLLETPKRLINAIRYVEANPVRARLVARAELWPWSSLNERLRDIGTLDDGPIPFPRDEAWLEQVNATSVTMSTRDPRRRSRNLELPPG